MANSSRSFIGDASYWTLVATTEMKMETFDNIDYMRSVNQIDNDDEI